MMTQLFLYILGWSLRFIGVAVLLPFGIYLVVQQYHSEWRQPNDSGWQLHIATQEWLYTIDAEGTVDQVSIPFSPVDSTLYLSPDYRWLAAESLSAAVPAIQIMDLQNGYCCLTYTAAERYPVPFRVDMVTLVGFRQDMTDSAQLILSLAETTQMGVTVVSNQTMLVIDLERRLAVRGVSQPSLLGYEMAVNRQGLEIARYATECGFPTVIGSADTYDLFAGQFLSQRPLITQGCLFSFYPLPDLGETLPQTGEYAAPFQEFDTLEDATQNTNGYHTIVYFSPDNSQLSILMQAPPTASGYASVQWVMDGQALLVAPVDNAEPHILLLRNGVQNPIVVSPEHVFLAGTPEGWLMSVFDHLENMLIIEHYAWSHTGLERQVIARLALSTGDRYRVLAEPLLGQSIVPHSSFPILALMNDHPWR